MQVDLTGKQAIVGGSTRGIGKAIAMQLAASGASVTLVARNEAALQEVRLQLPVLSIQTHQYLVADYSDPEQLKASLEPYLNETPVNHILVNNTGGPPAGDAIDAESGDYLAAFSQHLICNQILTQAVVSGMREAGYGRIINIISTSVKQPLKGLGVSNTVRAAVAQWAKTLAGELAASGITVNNVLPGATQTERLTEIINGRASRSGMTPATVEQAMRAAIPARRFGQVEELAAVVAFLASPQASYINGINLPVDGGRTLSL